MSLKSGKFYAFLANYTFRECKESAIFGSSAEEGAKNMDAFLTGTLNSAISPGSDDMAAGSPNPYSALSQNQPFSPNSFMSPSSQGPFSPTFNPMSPSSALSPSAASPGSPIFNPISPIGSVMSPSTDSYSPTSPMYTGGLADNAHPIYSPGAFTSPTSPVVGYRRTSNDVFDPSSPSYNSAINRRNVLSPEYSPRSPSLAPTSPAPGGMSAPLSPGAYTVSSPHYYPASPFSPSGMDITSPVGPTSPTAASGYGPASPYDPRSPFSPEGYDSDH